MTTILYIEPNPAAQQKLRSVLDQSYNLVTVADGPAAVQYCAMIQPDMVLLAADWADSDVSELTLRLKMFMPRTPILVFADTPSAPQTPVAGADGYLPRAAPVPELRERLRAWLPSTQPAQLAAPALEENAVAQFETQIQALNRANQRLASLNAISALIGTSLDLENLTDEILQQVQTTVAFDSATLFLLKGNILEAAASRGLVSYRRGLNVYPKSERNSAWRVVVNKLPLIINDVSQSEYWEPRPELNQVRAWLGVPLIFKDRVVGVLTLDRNEINAFSEADARFVFTLAFQIAIAVENAQLFEEWENQATRLKLINEVNQQLTTILDTNTLYNTLAQAIVERLGFDRVTVFEMAPLQDMLELRACRTIAHPELETLNLAPCQLAPDAGLIGQAIKSGQPVLAGELSATAGVLAGMPVKSALIIPIFVENRVAAVISIDSLSPGRFTDQDLWTLSSMATQAATVIENARLYQGIDAYSAMLEKTVSARTQRLQAIKQISQVISQSVSLDALLTVLGREISRIFSAPQREPVQVATGLLSGAGLVVRVIFDAGLTNCIENGTVRLEPLSAVGQVVWGGKPAIVRNVPIDGIYAEGHTSGSPVQNTLMIAPLTTAGKTIGVILVNGHQRDLFDEDDLETLESVAFQVASAIEYARLLRKTKEMAIVDERTRLARDMHDGVAQNLAYLLIQVDRCLDMVDKGSNLEQQLETIGALLENNIAELRRNIFDLRPLEFEGRTLFGVLENFVTEFGKRWNLQVSWHAQGQIDDVPPEIESGLYRILQEGLSNARKHARCQQVSVTLTVRDRQWLVLQIEDDGQGFDLESPQNPTGSAGLGLVSMRERAHSVNGHLSIETSPAAGTRLIAELPLNFDQKGY